MNKLKDLLLRFFLRKKINLRKAVQWLCDEMGMVPDRTPPLGDLLETREHYDRYYLHILIDLAKHDLLPYAWAIFVVVFGGAALIWALSCF